MGVQDTGARKLVREYADDLSRIQRQIAYWPYRLQEQAIANPPGYLINAIRRDYAAPPAYTRAHAVHTAAHASPMPINDTRTSEERVRA